MPSQAGCSAVSPPPRRCEQPAILTPDVGGLALCCDEFRIVDLALLSNRKLAHRGHDALAEVLEAESPEIVEAHWKWAALGGLYELPNFRARYVPAFAGGTKLWIRRDVAATIESKGRGCRVAVDRGDVQKRCGPSLREARSAQGQKQLRTCRGRSSR